MEEAFLKIGLIGRYVPFRVHPKEGGSRGGQGRGVKDIGYNNPTYLKREEQNPPLDWIVSTTVGPCSKLD